ncbi:cbb3-type cytochrome c oxidase N-terminal domain-containing protein [uncultured Sunxiuqinia sp.]|uniref:cbb3-type cytochrome c oxidase N-terminal domain-containing protein n=1 Tax=uncultured Sunxiuqinia sp. TaxID=1573825 RepID=UPI002AA6EFAB|nr:cbb3-type cytochrome c oxidase N-terminal domain-containing protein [uncultured Sunxiuqinia sp.]
MSTQEDKTPKNPTKQKPQPIIDPVTNVKMLGGHDFDGIRELDNRLPPWLKYLFYASIVFSASYLMLVFVFEDDSIIQEKEYQNEMATAMHQQEEPESSGETTIAPVERTQEEKLASGKETFNKVCSVCHGKFGEGLVGPNFTDEYWIHGGSREDMHKVIVNGVIEKGMISYKNQLTETQIQDVITYIQSLEGTNPPNQKAPQGEKYVPESE